MVAPGANDAVTIDTVSALSTDVITGTGNSASLTIAAANEVNSAVDLAGTFTTGALTLASGALMLTGGHSLTVNGAATVQGNGVTISGGTMTVNGNVTDSGSGSGYDVSGGGSLVITGNFSPSVNAGILSDAFVANGGTISVAGTVTAQGTWTKSPIMASAGGHIQFGGLVGTAQTVTSGGGAIQLGADATGSVEIGTAGNAAAGSVTIDSGITVSLSGLFYAPQVVINGTVSIVSGGSVGIEGGTFTYDPSQNIYSSSGILGDGLTGSGTIQINAASRLSIGGVMANAANTIAFIGNGGSLTIGVNSLNSSGTFLPTITGFNSSDVIDLTALTYQSSYKVVWNATSGLTQIVNTASNNAIVATLTLTGVAFGAVPVVSADSNGGTELLLTGSDPSLPALTLTSPASILNGTNLTLNGTINSANAGRPVTLTINGHTVQTVNSSGSGSWSLNGTVAATGLTVVNVSATDAAGNSGGIPTIYVAETGGSAVNFVPGTSNLAFLQNTAGNADTVTGSNGTVYLNGNSASLILVSSGGNTVNVGESGSTVATGGNGQNGASDYFNFTSGGVLNEAAGANINAFGSGVTVNANGSDNLGLYGANDSANISGTGSEVWTGGNGQNGASDYITFTNGGVLNEASGANINAFGSGVSVYANGSDNLGLYGANDTATISGTGSQVWTGGNGQNGASDYITFTNGGVLNEASGANINAFGSGVTVNTNGSDNLGLYGANDSANISGTGSQVWTGGNGQNGTSDYITFTNGGVLNEVAGANINVFGSGVAVNASGSDNLGLYGANDSATISGTGSQVWTGGNGQNGASDYFHFANGGVVNEAANASINTYGNSLTVNANASDNLGIYGTGDTVKLGANDGVWAGSGSDLFALAGATGHDTITGFVATGSNHDTLQFSSSAFADWAHLLGATKQQGSDLLITLDANDTVLLKNISLANFTSADAKFV